MTRRGRPRGQIGTLVLQAYLERPRTLHEAAADLQLSYARTAYTVSRLVSTGELAVIEKRPTGRRHASVFGPPEPSATAISPQRQTAAELHFVMGMMIRGGRR